MGVDLPESPAFANADDEARAQLRSFDCGARWPHEKIAERAIRLVSERRVRRPAVLRVGTVDGAIAAAGAARWTRLGPHDGWLLQAIACAKPFRGGRFGSPPRTLAHAMLDDVMAAVGVAPDGRTPPWFAFIDDANRASRRLFAERGFEASGLSEGGLRVWMLEGSERWGPAGASRADAPS